MGRRRNGNVGDGKHDPCPFGHLEGERVTWQEWLGERPIAVIATTDGGGIPHAVPVEVVVHEGRVYSWGRSGARRMRHINASGFAAVVAYKGDSFVLVRGRARLIDASDPRYEPITQLFLKKYAREETFGNDALVEVMPDRVTERRA